MAALVADRMTIKTSSSGMGLSVAYTPAAAVQIYLGSIVAISTSTGFLNPAAALATLRVVGVSGEKCLGDGVNKILVERGAHWFTNHGTDICLSTDVGADCYAADDQTVARVNTGNRPRAGRILSIDAAKGVLVEFN